MQRWADRGRLTLCAMGHRGWRLSRQLNESAHVIDGGVRFACGQQKLPRCSSSYFYFYESPTMRPLRAVAVSGGQHPYSKSTLLAAHLLNLIAQHAAPCEHHLLTLGHLAPQLVGPTWRSNLPTTAEQALTAVEQADVVVVVTPIFRGSYTGMFKHFFDLIHQDALIDTPILLAAVGGSQRHALTIDHQLRPLFSFFQARTLPLGIYATDHDFTGQRLCNAALLERAELAVQRAIPLIALARNNPARMAHPTLTA